MQFSFRPGVARQLALAASVLSAASFLTSCNKGADFTKTKSGMEYNIFKNVNGKYEPRDVANGEDPTYKDRVGKIMAAHIEYRTAGDSVMMKSRERQFGVPVRLPLEEVKMKGAEPEAFSLLQPGDSGVFRFNADSLYKRNAHMMAPAALKKKGNFITMTVKAVSVQTREAAMAEAMADQQKMQAEQQRQMRTYAATQDKKDDATLQDYMKKNNLTNAKKTAGGVYYIITQPGTGALPKPGQLVKVNYSGKLLDGKEFDNNVKHPETAAGFSFPLGRGQVIPGWDEGVGQLMKGSKATLLIPSSLAYGKQGSPPAIPADSPLRFDVELVDITNAPAGPAAMAPPAGH